MARGSILTDDVDPAPRILRLIASNLFASGEVEAKRLAARLRRDADVLEGAPLTADEVNGAHARLLARERRVSRTRRRSGAVPVGRAQRAARSPEDERHVQQLRDAGLWNDEDEAHPTE